MTKLEERVVEERRDQGADQRWPAPDGISRLRSSRRWSTRGMRPSGSRASAVAAAAARRPRGGVASTGQVGRSAAVLAARRTRAPAGAASSARRAARSPSSGCGRPGRRRLVVLLHLLDLGLEDPHGAAEAARGVREPLVAEQQHEDRRGSRADLGKLEVSHCSSPGRRQTSTCSRSYVVGGLSVRPDAPSRARRAAASAWAEASASRVGDRGEAVAGGGDSAVKASALRHRSGRAGRRRAGRSGPGRARAAPRTWRRAMAAGGSGLAARGDHRGEQVDPSRPRAKSSTSS